MAVQESTTAEPVSGPITVVIDDGQTMTFRPDAVIAILTKADRKTTTILLQGGMKVAVKGTGEGLRKRVFGTTPGEVQAAVKRQATRPAAAAARSPQAPKRAAAA